MTLEDRIGRRHRRRMWRRVEVNARIEHSVERVFPYLVEPERWHEFAPAVVMRRRIGDGPPAVGSRWHAADHVGPFTFRFTDELAELDRNRRVVWISSAPWNARTEYACEPDGGGTRIRAAYEGDLAGWLRLLGLVPPPVMGWILAQDFRRLEALLSGAEQPARPPVTGTIEDLQAIE